VPAPAFSRRARATDCPAAEPAMAKTHEPDESPDELLSGLDLDSPTQVFLSLRAQNLELLRMAIQTAGYAEVKLFVKPEDKRQAMDRIWEIYSEFYEWVDPETDDDEEA
jgi:hypothetical protein